MYLLWKKLGRSIYYLKKKSISKTGKELKAEVWAFFSFLSHNGSKVLLPVLKTFKKTPTNISIFRHLKKSQNTLLHSKVVSSTLALVLLSTLYYSLAVYVGLIYSDFLCFLTCLKRRDTYRSVNHQIAILRKEIIAWC